MQGVSTKHLQVLECPWQFLKDKEDDTHVAVFLICWVRSHHDSSLVRSGRSTANTDRPSVGWADAQKLDADFELQQFFN